MTKTAFVTGGSGGIGSSICKKLAQHGYQVFFTYQSNTDSAESLLDSLNGNNHHMVKLDVSNTSDINALARKLSISKLDVLVNCAAITKFIPHNDLNGLDDELFDRIMQINVRAPFTLIRALQPQLKAAGGCIINITSTAAQTARGSNIAYSASKSALENLTRSLARALAPDIRVLAIAPGIVDTDLVKEFDSEWQAKQAAKTPLKRIALDTEVADAVYIAIEHLTFTTGNSIAVDGGSPLGCL